MNMKINQAGIDLIRQFEGFHGRAYLCPAGVPTIGYGMTYYPDTGRKVSMSDRPISEIEGVQYLRSCLDSYEKAVDSMTTDAVNENKFSALVCFAYNIGNGALKGSTLLKLVNENPNNPSIKEEFLKWTHAGGEVLEGLRRRRMAEATLYFS